MFMPKFVVNPAFCLFNKNLKRLTCLYFKKFILALLSSGHTLQGVENFNNNIIKLSIIKTLSSIVV